MGHDPERDCLTLVRDAVGATQLFYARVRDGWAASFDLGVLLGHLSRKPKANEAALYDFLATHYRYVFREPFRTFHEGVYQVPAGQFVRLKGDSAVTERYLSLDFDPEASKLSKQEAADRYLAMLDDNLALRLEKLSGSDFGFTVSSGLDSATVACLAQRRLEGPLRAWTMSYSSAKGSPYDETPKVRELVAETGWELHALEMGAPDLLGEADRLMGLTHAPMVTVTWLANYHLARKAREYGHRFLFSGLGGDESLAGEFEHFFLFFADLLAAGEKGLLDKETEAWARLHATKEFPKGPGVRDAWISRNLDLATGEIRVDQPRYTQFRHWFDPDWVAERERDMAAPPMPRPYPYFLSNRLFQEMSHETSPPTLWSEALSSHAGGVKGVFPMASPRLFRLALSLPGTFKYQDGYTKMLIRRSTKGLLPDVSRLNPVKTGFNAPLDLWLRDPVTAGETLALLLSSPLRDKRWLREGALEGIVAEHQAGKRNNMMLLWPLIQTALFLNRLGG
jgi:asparagine synthase (glutamine-hydrolysing)